MKLFYTLAIGFFVTTSALSATWNIDSSHSAAHFKVRHMMVSNVHGQITGISGSVDLDDKDLTKSSVSATLDPNTINTNDAKRDTHLRSPDFFNVAKHAKIIFASSKVSGKEGALKVVGKLTMNGVTKDVELSVDGPTESVKGMKGELRRGLTATGKLNRKDYGIVWNKNLDGGGLVVGDDISITIDLELISSDQKS